MPGELRSWIAFWPAWPELFSCSSLLYREVTEVASLGTGAGALPNGYLEHITSRWVVFVLLDDILALQPMEQIAMRLAQASEESNLEGSGWKGNAIRLWVYGGEEIRSITA